MTTQIPDEQTFTAYGLATLLSQEDVTRPLFELLGHVTRLAFAAAWTTRMPAADANRPPGIDLRCGSSGPWYVSLATLIYLLISGGYTGGTRTEAV